MYHASPYVLSCLCLLAFVVPLGLKTLVCLAALSGASKMYFGAKSLIHFDLRQCVTTLSLLWSLRAAYVWKSLH